MDNHTLIHRWANRARPAEKCGNVFYEGDKIYSYGYHFCMARLIGDDAVIHTTARYSNTTACHLSIVRVASRHLKAYYCYDPDAPAYQNMAAARNAMIAKLTDAEKPRIRQTTREALRADATRIALQANEYLTALPAEEIGIARPISVSAADIALAIENARESAARKIEADKARKAAAIENTKLAVACWRDGDYVETYKLHALDCMLRVKGDAVETSKGAQIPVSDALKLWPVIGRVMRSDGDYAPGEPLGNYRLTKIRKDGSIVVGCHDIPYSEIERVAVTLGVMK